MKLVLTDIFAVIGRDLYGRVDPSRYGNLGRAVFTLFQLITLDDWFQMYSDINPGKCKPCLVLYEQNTKGFKVTSSILELL